MSTITDYICTEGYGDEVTYAAESTENAAREYAEEGRQEGVTRTEWIDVYVWPATMTREAAAAAGLAEWVTVTLDPEEPECPSGEGHSWAAPIEIVGGIRENPGVSGVSGYGGGTIRHEVCMRCGCGRTTDSWAHDSHGTQGLTAVEYVPGQYAEALARTRVHS